MTDSVKKKNIDLTKKLQRIRILILDVDGVLTNGGIYLGAGGMELKRFDVQDGAGIRMLQSAGIKVGIITGRSSEAVETRARELQIEACYQGVKDKKDAFDKILKKYNITEESVCYVGDDIQDLSLIKFCGVGIAVKNARPEVKKAADYTTQAKGGESAVREVAELILKAQGKWKEIIDNI
jgi:3-deoxy-D-manno-octulosonate 8-phosphate phosphatase (KDO 8-P phosphatase)